ncbi:hypothetical protein EG827_13100 [bacterium]|nr:hypothetical protein [bacterium]
MKKDERILIPRDEFEEEAGEGLGRLSREEAEADLRELKARMESRMRRPRAIWIPAAAAVVILLVASGILVTMLRERPAVDSRLAQKEKAGEELTLDDSTILANAGEVANDTALIAMARPIEKEERTTLAPVVNGVIVPEAAAEATDELYAVVAEDAVTEVVDNEPVISMVVVGEEMAEVVVVEAIPQAMAAARKDRAATETREAAAARDEKKALAAKDVTDKAEATAGVIPATGAVPDTGGAQKGGSVNPLPLGGWEKYAEWVAGNIRYPAGVQPVMRQEVVVSFTVQPDSTLTDIKAVSSPGEPFTREAFRLLREGPKWVPAGSGGKAVAEEVMVKVVFK